MSLLPNYWRAVGIPTFEALSLYAGLAQRRISRQQAQTKIQWMQSSHIIQANKNHIERCINPRESNKSYNHHPNNKFTARFTDIRWPWGLAGHPHNQGIQTQGNHKERHSKCSLKGWRWVVVMILLSWSFPKDHLGEVVSSSSGLQVV